MIENEFSATTFNDSLKSGETLSCEPTVSSLNDEDYTVIFDKNSFSYKIISTNDLKTDSENDNEKVMPSLPPPEPAISCFDDLDFFKDFEIEFLAIFYNDALTSKSNLLPEPFLNPQHIEEFDLKNETSLPGYDEEEQSVLYFNDLFPFIIIRPDDLNSEEGNDDNDIDIIQSSEGEVREDLQSRDTPSSGCDFQGMPELMGDCLFARIMMEHRDDAGAVVFTSQAWGRLFDTGRSLVWELILEFLSTLRFGEFILALGLHTREEMESPGFARMMGHSIAGRSQTPKKVTVTDLFYLRGLDVGSVNIPYLLARYLRKFAAGRKSRAHIFGGQFVGRLAQHFGLLTAEILRGLAVIALELPIIDMDELVRLHICVQLDDTWAWVAMGPERQLDAMVGAPGVAQDAF
ncbi:hypothetical protein Tco_1432037, partial [Tanacetum coccineum]